MNVCWSLKGGAGTTVVAAGMAIAAARSGIDDLAVTTDLIVGFPGETEEDFERTLEVVAEVGYDSAYCFVFSPREGTEAAEMVGDFVDHDVCVDRFERLQRVLRYLSLRRLPAQVRRPTEVALVVEPGRALGRADVEAVVGSPVRMRIPLDPAIARAVDAGLLARRAPRALLRAVGDVASSP